MRALSGDLAMLSRQALTAGCDVVLHCNGTLADRKAVAEAAGAMTDTAQTRAEAALACRRSPDPVDIFALTAQLDALTGGRMHG
jgi:beta-N-acetylhexosaminidase